MNRETIKKLALANGFKLKPQPNGEEDLNPYVYDFVQALLQTAKETPAVVETYPVTIVVEVPKGVEFPLSALINVQGLQVKCTSIAWETNSVSEAFALEQRLEVALDLLEGGDIFSTDIDGYKSRLKELHEAGELTEHSIDERIDLTFEDDADEQS